MTQKQQQDLLYRYLFKQHHVRGELVQLQDCYAGMLENHNYPDVVKRVLGELLSATCLLTATLKFEGDISVQLQGAGALSYAVVNGNNKQKMRAAAKYHPEIEEGTIPELTGQGFMVITIAPEDGERYQGVVALDKPTLAECIEGYFMASEQLRTRIWLETDINQAKTAGMLLQVLPVEEKAQDDFTHLEVLTNTVKAEELLDLEPIVLLTRLYHEDNPELFEPQLVTYECGCSREKTADAVRRLTHDDAKALLEERGNIEIDCQFCLKKYIFDSIDVEAIFADNSQSNDSIN